MTTSPHDFRIQGRIALVAGGAIAAALLAGCSGQLGIKSANAASPVNLFGREDARATKAVARAEAAVANAPRDASARTALGHAYLDAGRFASAMTTFEDALSLGDENGRTMLGLALAQIGSGRSREAIAVLDQWRDVIPAGDLGLALALAGETSRGVAILTDAVRGGDNSPKLRQNLAYAYALDGRWTEAKLMAAQDVPADQLDKRLAFWALSMLPDRGPERVAALVGAPAGVPDAGQPAALALNDVPEVPQMAATAPLPAPAGAMPVAADRELPPATSLATVSAPAPAPAGGSGIETIQAAHAAPAALSVAKAFANADAPRASAPAPREATAAPARRIAAPKMERSTIDAGHYVQLGAFSSEQNAKRAWGYYARRNPALTAYRMTITEADVNGRHVWRVAAGGLTGRMAATTLCSRVRSSGTACFAYHRPIKAVPGVSAPVLQARAKPQAAPKAMQPAMQGGPQRARR